MSSAVIVLADGFEETEAITIIDLLRRAQCAVTVLGLDDLTVTGSHGITITADSLLSSYTGTFDAVILPGGMPGTRNLAESQAVLDIVRRAHAQKKLVAAICAAPLVLATAGILQNTRVTCFPGIEKELGTAQFVGGATVVDGSIITGKSLGTAIEFSCAVITYLEGSAAAEKVRSAICLT